MAEGLTFQHLNIKGRIQRVRPLYLYAGFCLVCYTTFSQKQNKLGRFGVSGRPVFFIDPADRLGYIRASRFGEEDGMSGTTCTQQDVDVLNGEYKAWVENLKREWLSRNRIDSKDVYEVMRPHQRAEVHRRMAQWSDYITPLAEA